MGYRLEQGIDGPAGTHPVLDRVRVRAASGAEVFFIEIVALSFYTRWMKGRDRYRPATSSVLLSWPSA